MTRFESFMYESLGQFDPTQAFISNFGPAAALQLPEWQAMKDDLDALWGIEALRSVENARKVLEFHASQIERVLELEVPVPIAD